MKQIYPWFIGILITVGFTTSYAQTVDVKLNPSTSYYLDSMAINKSSPENADVVFKITSRISNGMFLGYYKKQAVYIRPADIQSTSAYDKFITKYFVKTATQNFDDAHKELFKKYGKSMGLHILQKQVVMGMEKEAVEASWGKPDEVTTSQTGNDILDFWMYVTDSNKKKYVFFTKGFVSKIYD